MTLLISVDSKVQRYISGPQPLPDVVVQHTTEVMAWPTYAGGGEAPHATIWPIPGQGIRVREHIDFTQYAKALMNLPGGVETNRRGVIQFEMVGTCDPKNASDPKWYYWPNADDVVLQALAEYQRPILMKYGIPFAAPAFLPYPDSYGSKNGQRFTAAQWTSFRGICGHQHVPENDHGDPGAFPIGRFLTFLRSTQEDFMSELSPEEQRNLYNRVMGGIPEGDARGRKNPDGTPTRVLDTLDGNYMLGWIKAGVEDPQAIANAIPASLAQQVIDALAAKLSTPKGS